MQQSTEEEEVSEGERGGEEGVAEPDVVDKEDQEEEAPEDEEKEQEDEEEEKQEDEEEEEQEDEEEEEEVEQEVIKLVKSQVDGLETLIKIGPQSVPGKAKFSTLLNGFR